MSNDLMNTHNNWMDFGNDNLFNHFAKNFFRDDFGFPNLIEKHGMKTDVSENDAAYTVTIDLPGLKKENIEIEYNDGILSVSGKQEHENEEQNEEGEVIHSERYYGSYRRQYVLPHVNREAISAKYDGGVLKLNLPKFVEGDEKRKIEIQ